jgi:DNA-binding transcriptional regulator GbsR (MarR family)
MRKKHNFFSGDFAQNFSQLVEANNENEFLDVLRKVTHLMQIQDDTHYSQILSKNIQSMAAEIEMKLDEYLDKKGISFRTEVFLLIIFQELFDKYVLK